MWPSPPLPPAADVSAQLTVLFASSLIVVFGLLAALVAREASGRRG
jgi:hypothetical protein